MAFDVLCLIQSLKNGLAPINLIPPEVLALVPDFWDRDTRDQDVIALTHTCRTWREIFISRASLWTDFDCEDTDKTRVYLERSKTSPISVSLERVEGLSPRDPFLELVPNAISRFKSLTISVPPENLQDFTDHLFSPAPLLETFKIEVKCEPGLQHHPLITPALFDGDFSSLRVLCLRSVRTELPWRNMANLTSFILDNMPPGEVSVGQFLDFFESAPRLREIQLISATTTSGAQDGRLVSLACLTKLSILGGRPPPLLNHLLIPVGATLTTQVESPHSRIEDHLPQSLDNLKNLPGFTHLFLTSNRQCFLVAFAGPNGNVVTISIGSEVDTIDTILESFARLDTSTAKQLEISYSSSPPEDLLHRALIPMTNLSTVTISGRTDIVPFVCALNPDVYSPNTLICPRLEDLVLSIDGYDVEYIEEMVAARALRGAKLKTITVANMTNCSPEDMAELGEHVLHVEYL